MTQNGNSELTSKQRKAVNSLAEGLTLEDAALAAGVHSRTVYRWLEEPAFTDELRLLQRRAATGHMLALSAELTRNRGVMIAARDAGDAPWHVRLRAAQALEDSLMRWREGVDFEERLTALETAHNAK